MQTPKSRPVSFDVPKRRSPNTPTLNRKLKTDSGCVSSPNSVDKTPKNKCFKVILIDERPPQSSSSEMKGTTSVSELESQLSLLQNELKTAKGQWSSYESWRSRAQHEAEVAKKQLATKSSELEETKKQLNELSDSEEARIRELRKICQDRDRAWQSELEAVEKQHLMDSAALASAMNEIHKLKIHLERVLESEASQTRHAESAYAEIQSLRYELTETLGLVGKLKEQLNDSQEFEARAVEEVSEVRMELDIIRTAEKALQSEHANVVESYKSLLLELDKSKERINSLEELVANRSGPFVVRRDSSEDGEVDESEEVKANLAGMKLEMEREKSESSKRVNELEEMLKASFEELEELREKLRKESAAFEAVTLENEGLNRKIEEIEQAERDIDLESQLKESELMVEGLNSDLLYKDTLLKSITDENEKLKSEIVKKNRASSEALTLMEAARIAEREALLRLRYMTEEADKSSRNESRVIEQLNAAQGAYSEIEAEFKRLKIQSDQWRKAAEAAAAMLVNGDNGKYIERTSSLELGRKLGSPYYEDMEDDSPKKKNGNMLKKIGVLLKKGQK